MNAQTQARRSAVGPGGGPASRRRSRETASGDLGKFGHSKAYVDPRHAYVSWVKSAEGVTHSVMDTLDYGISSPQLAMMNNGQVFVAGQYEPPMNPPTGASPAPEDKEMAGKEQPMISTSGLSILVGSSLLGDIGLIQIMKEDDGTNVVGASGLPAYKPLGISAQQFAYWGELALPNPGVPYVELLNFKRGGPWDLQRLDGGCQGT